LNRNFTGLDSKIMKTAGSIVGVGLLVGEVVAEVRLQRLLQYVEGSDQGALPASRLVGFPGLPSEPD